MELPIAPIGRIIKNAGAERISKDADIILARYLEKEGERIAYESIGLAKHAGRKTVKPEDIQLVIKHANTINITHISGSQGIQAGSNNLQNFEGDIYNFSELYEIAGKNPNSDEIKDNLRLIEKELEKGDVCLSKIKKPIDLIKKNANWAIPSIANLTLAAVNLKLI